MRVTETAPVRQRAAAVIDDREPCVVPRCGVRSRNLDAWGVCPAFLHDERHDAYVAATRRYTVAGH